MSQAPTNSKLNDTKHHFQYKVTVSRLVTHLKLTLDYHRCLISVMSA